MVSLVFVSCEKGENSSFSDESSSKITSESITESETDTESDTETETDMITKFKSITAEEAKEIMAEQTGFVILDVRTQSEFDTGHIEGAILLPLDEIKTKAKDILLDKNQLILVYCRSGNRSRTAANELVQLGYTNVYDFGGIIQWPYETVR